MKRTRQAVEARPVINGDRRKECPLTGLRLHPISAISPQSTVKTSRIVYFGAASALIILLLVWWSRRTDREAPRATTAKLDVPEKHAGNPLPTNPEVTASESAGLKSPVGESSDLPPEPLSGPGQVAPIVRVAAWKNAGHSTVGALVQSQFWAMAHGDTDYLQRTTLLDEPFRQALERLLDRVSPGIRAQYPTPESLAAFLLASGPALEGYALASQTQASPDESSVAVLKLEPGKDRPSGERQNFRRNADGEWYRVIGSREISHWSNLIKWDQELSKSRKWPQPQ